MSNPIPKETPATENNKPATQQADRDQYIKELSERLQKMESAGVSTKSDNTRLVGDMKKKADEKASRTEAKYKDIKAKVDQFIYSTDEKWHADKAEIEKSFLESSGNSRPN